MDRAPAGQEVVLDGELHSGGVVELAVPVLVVGQGLPGVPTAVAVLVGEAVVLLSGQLQEVLDRALAVAALAHEGRAAVVLQGPADDLAGGRAEAVDQDGHRQLLRHQGRHARLVGAPPPDAGLGGHHRLVRGQEQVRHVARLVQEPARVVAQVQHEGGGSRLEQLLQGDGDLLAGHAAEGGQLHEAHAAGEHGVVDRRDRDDPALDRDGHVLGRAVDEGRVHAAAPHVELHRRARLALEALDHLLALLTERGPVPNADDLVVAGEARLVRRARVDRTGDREEPVLPVDVHVRADPAVLGLEVLLELLPRLRVEERGVGIHALEEALHGGLEELVARDAVSLDVEAADHLHQGLEAPQLRGELGAAGGEELLTLAVGAAQLGVLEAADLQLLEVGLGQAPLCARLGGDALEHGDDALHGLHHAEGGEGQGRARADRGVRGLQELEQEALGAVDLGAEGDLMGRGGAADAVGRGAVGALGGGHEGSGEGGAAVLVRAVEAGGRGELGRGHHGLGIGAREDAPKGLGQGRPIGFVPLQTSRDQEERRARGQPGRGELPVHGPVEGGPGLVPEDACHRARLAEEAVDGGLGGLQGLLREQGLQVVLGRGAERAARGRRAGGGGEDQACGGRGRQRRGHGDQKEQGVHGRVASGQGELWLPWIGSRRGPAWSGTAWGSIYDSPPSLHGADTET